MTNEEYINELKILVDQARGLFDAEDLHENNEFRKWRQKLTALIIAAEENGYNVETDVISREFDIFVAYGSQPTIQKRTAAFNQELQDTINELETIIEHHEKFSVSKNKENIINSQSNKENNIVMKGIKIPVWLIALCVFIFLGVILEQLYVSKNPVDIWGFKLGKNTIDNNIPKGTIISWDPVYRSVDGKPTGKTRKIPLGWVICDGTNKTPNINNRFLMGVTAKSVAGKYGGKNTIDNDGLHAHGGAATNLNYKTGEINWDRREGRRDQFSHKHSISADGNHNHGGDKRPAYYGVLFLCYVE